MVGYFFVEVYVPWIEFLHHKQSNCKHMNFFVVVSAVNILAVYLLVCQFVCLNVCPSFCLSVSLIVMKKLMYTTDGETTKPQQCAGAIFNLDQKLWKQNSLF